MPKRGMIQCPELQGLLDVGLTDERISITFLKIGPASPSSRPIFRKKRTFMAYSQEYLEYILDQLSLFGEVNSQKDVWRYWVLP